MKHKILILVAALALPGCLQNETTIRLNKDGSGTLVEQTTLGAQMMGMLDQFSALGGGADAKDPVAEMFSEEKAKAKAATMGEGVTFEKSEPITIGANRGARTTYRFADINQLQISPGEGMNELSPMAGQAAAAAKKKPVKFNFADGTLSITMPIPEKPATPPAGAPAAPDLAGNPQMEGMMKQMLGDMKVSFKLVIEPGIAETNATHREGNTITLMSMEMAGLLENPETLKKLSAADQSNPAAAFEALKGIEGVKMETQPTVTVKLD
jgi:hypothetical protein